MEGEPPPFGEDLGPHPLKFPDLPLLSCSFQSLVHRATLSVGSKFATQISLVKHAADEEVVLEEEGVGCTDCLKA